MAGYETGSLGAQLNSLSIAKDKIITLHALEQIKINPNFKMSENSQLIINSQNNIGLPSNCTMEKGCSIQLKDD